METQTIVIIALVVLSVLGVLLYVLSNINKRSVKGQEKLSYEYGHSKQEVKPSALSYVSHEELTNNMSTASNFKYQDSQEVQTPPIKSVNSQGWVTSQQGQQALAEHEQQQERDKLSRQRAQTQGRASKKASKSGREQSEFRSALDKHPKAAQSFLNQRMSGKGKQTTPEPAYEELTTQNSQDLVKDKANSSKLEVFNMMKSRKPESEIPLAVERQSSPESQLSKSRKSRTPVQRVNVPNPVQTQTRLRGMQPGATSARGAASTSQLSANGEQAVLATASASSRQMTLNDYTPNPDYLASHQTSARVGNFTFNEPSLAPQVAVQGGKENYLHSTSLNQGGFVKGLSETDFNSLVGAPNGSTHAVGNAQQTTISADYSPRSNATESNQQGAVAQNLSSTAFEPSATVLPRTANALVTEANLASPDQTSPQSQAQNFEQAPLQVDLSNLTPESLAAILAQTNLTQAYRNVSGTVPLNEQFLKSTVIPEGVAQEKLQQANIFAHIETDPVIRQLNGLFQNEAHGYHIFKLEPSRSQYLSKELLVNLFNNHYLTEGLSFTQDVEHACYRLMFKNMETRKNVTLLFVFLDKGQFTSENLAREIEYLILYIPKRYFERNQDNILTYLLTRLVSLRGRLSGEITLHGRRIEPGAMYTTSTMRRAVQNILENK